MMVKVLVFGDDTGPCLAIARSLGRRGIEVHLTAQSAGSAASYSKFVSQTHLVPLYSGEGSGWRDAVRELCATHRYELLIPTSDSSLTQLRAHQREFPNAKIALSNYVACVTFTDKNLTRELASGLGVPIAEGTLVELADGKWRLGRHLELPLVLKKRQSYRCGDRAQKAPVVLAATKTDLQRALDTGQFDFAEAYLPGFCRGISVLARDGEVMMAHQHRRLQQKHATGPSSRRVSERCDPKLLGWTEDLVAATRLTGVAMFEYRHDPHSGRTVLLEVNPRFWGSLPLALEAGADFPASLFGMLVEQRDAPRRIGSRPGVVKSNLENEFYALSHAIEQVRSWRDYPDIAVGAVRLAAHLINGRAFDSWAPDDRAPFWVERQQVLSNLRSAFLRRFRSLRSPPLEVAE